MAVERLNGKGKLHQTEVSAKMRTIIAEKEMEAGREVRKLTDKYLLQEVERRTGAGLHVPERVFLKDYRNGNKAWLEFEEGGPVIRMHQKGDDDGEIRPWKVSDPEMIELGPLAVTVFNLTVEEYDNQETENWEEDFSDFNPQENLTKIG